MDNINKKRKIIRMVMILLLIKAEIIVSSPYVPNLVHHYLQKSMQTLQTFDPYSYFARTWAAPLANLGAINRRLWYFYNRNNVQQPQLLQSKEEEEEEKFGCFIGLKIPKTSNHNLISVLTNLQQTIKEMKNLNLLTVQYMPWDNQFHVTLRFETVTEKACHNSQKIIQSYDLKPITLNFDQSKIAAFQSPQNKSEYHLVLTVGLNPRDIGKTMDGIAELPPRTFDFIPHITIAKITTHSPISKIKKQLNTKFNALKNNLKPIIFNHLTIEINKKPKNAVIRIPLHSSNLSKHPFYTQLYHHVAYA